MKDEAYTTVNILVFVALPEEHDRLQDAFPPIETVPHAELVLMEHQIETDGFRMFSVLAKGMGIDNAHHATQVGINAFSPDTIVCLGIAGSLSPDLKIGDISISNEIIDVSQNIKISETRSVRPRTKGGRRSKRKLKPPQAIIELSPRSIYIDPEITASFRFLRSYPNLKGKLSAWSSSADKLRRELIGEASDSILSHEIGEQPFAEIGPIISGPVVASSAFRAVLKKLNRKVLSIETESAGVARAAEAAKIPFVTIRGISDHADMNKNALERTTKLGARRLAMDNAVSYFALQLQNPTFMRVASGHCEQVNQPGLFEQNNTAPDYVMNRVVTDLNEYLERMSPEYKSRPNKAILPVPRVTREISDEDISCVGDNGPQFILDAIRATRGIFLKLPKSYPNQTLAWSIGQTMLRGEIDSKQILPLVVSGEEIIPPRKGLAHASGFDPSEKAIQDNFSSVIIVHEPQFSSEAKIGFLIDELSKYPYLPLLVVSRADSPTDQIDRLKSDLALVDYLTAPVPFKEIATYLEAAFEMKPAEADTVASRLDETFSKFRLHTHPAYFVGLQEATIEALIQANQRAELIQLAVDGLLSFVVAFDESKVKLSRTTREEFLTELVYEIRVNGKRISRDEVLAFVRDFGARKALEVEPEVFLHGFFAIGLLYEISDQVAFSVPYLESYLLSERLRSDDHAARQYFDPSKSEFDQYTFDLYVERGACEQVVSAICEFARGAIASAGEEENVYLSRGVKPRALSSPYMLLQQTKRMAQAVERMGEDDDTSKVRQQKQQLIDAREAVRGKVASKDPRSRDNLPQPVRDEFERLDRLSRCSVLLATIVGSGAERLNGDIKTEISVLCLQASERFAHLWTKNRLGVDFDELRKEVDSDEVVDSIMEDAELYEEKDRKAIREDLMVFLDDQELRYLSGPMAVLFNRIAQYAGVRSLKPVVSALKPDNKIQQIMRDIWLMDVESQAGQRALKETIKHYKGSPSLRLVIASHLLNRMFWHHWQRESRGHFLEAARYSLSLLGLRPSDGHTTRQISGPPKK